MGAGRGTAALIVAKRWCTARPVSPFSGCGDAKGCCALHQAHPVPCTSAVPVAVPCLCAVPHAQALRKELHTRHITALRTTEFAQVGCAHKRYALGGFQCGFISY